jgi:bifunctional UDP-N-acetylglucosamine pyrophosphorylase/glucosamine-1-phosphate N-acetyltransferase
MNPRTVIILAAGEGKRMKSAVPKMLHPLLGRTIVGHVVATAATLAADRTLAVVGRGADQVTPHLADIAPDAVPVLQAEQRGTGHAVRIALEAAPEAANSTVVVLNGDVPLVRPETLAALVAEHEGAGAAATVLTAELADPTGLGRIIRDATGGLAAIVEERDASPEQRAIREINGGVYAFDGAQLAAALGKLTTENDQGEEYLTDVIGLFVAGGHRVVAYPASDSTETLGVNDRAELAGLRAVLRDRVNLRWMRDGVTILDPATTWVDVTVALGRDVVVEPHTQLCGTTEVGERAVVGPDTTVVDSTIGEGASVVRAHVIGAEIGPRASVGPYAYLRKGTRLGRSGKVGTFVETKNAEIGEGTKVPHLSYIGDATIGEQTNIGAASVTANYDGTNKHRTVIGSHVKIGVDNMFVAPVEIGDGVYTGAGTVVRRNVPPGALAVSGGPQRNLDGWVEAHRPGSAAARAARASGEAATGDTATEESD